MLEVEKINIIVEKGSEKRKMQFRSDSIEGSKLAWEKTPHGYVAFATLAKIGHPLTYVEGGKTREEYVASFSEDSISSVRGMPICLAHPQSVTYQGNKSGAGIGHFLQELLVTDQGELLAPVTVTDKRGIDLIDKCLANGENPEISPAYWVESVRADGKGGYEQIRGRYDHAALLLPGQGRGGGSIALRLDNIGVNAMSDISTEPVTTTTTTGNSNSQLELKISELTKTVESLTGENAGLKSQLSAMSETHLSLDSINAKLNTLAKIGKINLDSVDLKVSATEIQKQHILTLNPAIDLTGKSDEYVAGVFESLTGVFAPVAVETGEETQIHSDSGLGIGLNAIATAKGHLAGTRSDSFATTDPIELAKQKRLQQIESAHKKTA